MTRQALLEFVENGSVKTMLKISKDLDERLGDIQAKGTYSCFRFRYAEDMRNMLFGNGLSLLPLLKKPEEEVLAYLEERCGFASAGDLLSFADKWVELYWIDDLVDELKHSYARKYPEDPDLDEFDLWEALSDLRKKTIEETLDLAIQDFKKEDFE